MYTSHVTRVEWNGVCSDYFSVRNGVKQGGMISSVLFCVYVDGLLKLLSDVKVDCYIGHVFVGALAYADYIVLLAPTARAMRKLLSLCDEFASGFDVLFNAKQSKCLYIWRKKDNKSNCCLTPMFNIGGNAIEFVRQWPHLGNLINDICDDKDDILKNAIECADKLITSYVFLVRWMLF